MRTQLFNISCLVIILAYTAVSFSVWIPSEAKYENALLVSLPAWGLFTSVLMMVLIPFTTIGNWLNSKPQHVKAFGYLYIDLIAFFTFAAAWNLLIVPLFSGLASHPTNDKIIGALWLLITLIVFPMWIACLITVVALTIGAFYQKLRKPGAQYTAGDTSDQVSLVTLSRWWIFLLVASLAVTPVFLHGTR